MLATFSGCDGAIPAATLAKLQKINMRGPYLGLVIPNAFEMGPLLQSSSFVPNKQVPYLDFGGRRFRFATIEGKKVVVVMTGLSMLNAGTATQLLLNLFDIEGVLHFGIAGNADPELQIGDVTVPQSWAHLGLWNWQRFGQGPNDQLALEANGDYTRQFGSLRFADYNSVNGSDNLLNAVWYQPEEVFPRTGTPEVRQHAFWVAADAKYLALADKLKGIELQRCTNATTCLPRDPQVSIVSHGCSANTFVDNAAYRQFLRAKFNVTPIDMESAAVALVCLQYSKPFIAIRSLSDLAGGGSGQSNEAAVFGALAAQNAVTAVVKFVSLLKQA